MNVVPHPPGNLLPSGLHRLGLARPRDGLLMVPRTQSLEAPMPLLVLLHGAGRAATDWFGSYQQRAIEMSCLMLAIDSRKATWDVGISGAIFQDPRFIERAISFAFARCAVDTQRIAIAGLSDGATYALSIGLANGELFQHIIAFSPGGFFGVKARGRPKIFISHGVSDYVLPIDSTTRKFAPRLRERGYQVDVVEFDGGHEVPPPISSQALNWWLR